MSARTAATLLALSLAACRWGYAAQDAGVRGVPEVKEQAFSSGLQKGWMDYGWCPRQLDRSGPALLDLSSYGGWILAREQLVREPMGVSLLVKLEDGPVGRLDVWLDSSIGGKLPKVTAGRQHQVAYKQGFVQLYFTASELNPNAKPFDKLVIQGHVKGELKNVEVDGVGLVADGTVAAPPPAAATTAEMSVDCRAPGQAISPLIYGVSYDFQKAYDKEVFELGITARRWGGNASSRYNWKLGNAWNTANDWYYRNVNYTGNARYTYRDFLSQNAANGVKTVMTLPALGWVAKDTETVGFPVSLVGPQQRTDPYRKDAGNGLSAAGKPVRSLSPTQTSVAAPPEFIAEWVRAMSPGKDGTRPVAMYILDNEPMLWNETHRDVHPQATTYDELWDMTVRYGTAVREADPSAVIAGPAEWGWTAYFYSAADKEAGFLLRPDRRNHGDVPLLQWYLRQLRLHEEKTGKRLVDVLDVHYYPQGKGLGLGDAAQTDPDTAALRLRATRSLWDPTYTDESWVDDKVRLIPRLREWISQERPGLGISIGEYDFGAERHMSGALAQAEALGRFGQLGVTAAFRWGVPAKGTPMAWAFRAFRNYDGTGGRFQDISLPANAPDGMSLFASRSAAKDKLVLVLLNLDPAARRTATIDVSSCGEVQKRRVFQYDESRRQLEPLPAAKPTSGKVVETLAPYSITVVELQTSPAKSPLPR